jgi:mannose-1-phosphate guanylyltransferase/mannose-6-phosphate isomerase
MSVIVPSILCGGVGTRLWPLSRSAKPKQFHALTAPTSLLAETIARARAVPGASAPVLIAGESMRDIAAADAPPDARIVLEPAGKNTAPAAALAALAALEIDADAIVLMLPSDHHVGDSSAFVQAIGAGATLARDNHIVTFGISPTEPHEGYGYIVAGDPLGAGLTVRQFVEKPKLPRAKELIAAGGAYWNSGIYMFGARLYLEELGRLQPAMRAAVEAAWRGRQVAGPVTTLDAAAWSACEEDSIDYAVAEKTDRVATVPVRMAWSDVGSWAALYEIGARAMGANVTQGDVVAVDARGCLVRAESRLVAVVGVDDLVVVETADAVIVLPRERAQDVKKIVEQLKSTGRDSLL